MANNTPDKISKLPKGWGKLQARTAKALLNIEFSNLEAMIKSLDLEIDRLEAKLSKTNDEAEQALIIKESADRVAEVVARHVMRMRKKARALADESLEAELEELGIDPARTRTSASRADAAAAAAAGLSYASVWASTALSVILQTEEGQPKVRRSLENQDYRLERIAATETSRAFNDEHSRGVDSIADDESNKEKHWFPFIVKRWDAILDRKTCAICRDHDGDIVPLGINFSNDDTPGEVHPNCRCMSTLIPLPAFYTTEAA